MVYLHQGSLSVVKDPALRCQLVLFMSCCVPGAGAVAGRSRNVCAQRLRIQGRTALEVNVNTPKVTIR